MTQILFNQQIRWFVLSLRRKKIVIKKSGEKGGIHAELSVWITSRIPTN